MGLSDCFHFNCKENNFRSLLFVLNWSQRILCKVLEHQNIKMLDLIMNSLIKLFVPNIFQLFNYQWKKQIRITAAIKSWSCGGGWSINIRYPVTGTNFYVVHAARGHGVHSQWRIVLKCIFVTCVSINFWEIIFHYVFQNCIVAFSI